MKDRRRSRKGWAVVRLVVHCLGLCMLAGALAPRAGLGAEDPSIESLIRRIEGELLQFERRREAGVPPMYLIKEFELDIAFVIQGERGGGQKLVVVDGQGRAPAGGTHRIKLRLEMPGYETRKAAVEARLGEPPSRKEPPAPPSSPRTDGAPSLLAPPLLSTAPPPPAVASRPAPQPSPASPKGEEPPRPAPPPQAAPPPAVTPPAVPAPTPSKATPPPQATLGPMPPLKDILFARGSSTLDVRALRDLDEVIATLKARPTVQVVLQGHADDGLDEFASRQLGRGRAMAVEAYLREAGIPGDRIRTFSYGRERPLAEGEGEEVRGRNRAVRFFVLEK